MIACFPFIERMTAELIRLIKAVDKVVVDMAAVPQVSEGGESMILSLIATAAAATKWLVVAKVATTVGATCVAVQPLVDAYQQRHE